MTEFPAEAGVELSNTRSAAPRPSELLLAADLRPAAPRLPTTHWYVAGGTVVVTAVVVMLTMSHSLRSVRPDQPPPVERAHMSSSSAPSGPHDAEARTSGDRSQGAPWIPAGTAGTMTASGDAPAREPRTLPERASQPTVGDLSGWWDVTNQVEATSYQPYEGLRLGYRLQLTQAGTRITGQGYKFSEDGSEIPSESRTPIRVSGVLVGDHVALTFTERGARRTSAGVLNLDLTDERMLAGTFRSDAALASGSSVARRIIAP
jgi:hypothetical protein